MDQLIKNVAHETPFDLAGLVDIEPGRVNSVTLSQEPTCKVTVFAIAQGEGLSSHAAGGDAMPYVLEGTVELVINGVAHELHAGQAIVIPTGAPHSVRAVTDFKMLLTVVKPQA